jgi:hypothetical protein
MARFQLTGGRVYNYSSSERIYMWNAGGSDHVSTRRFVNTSESHCDVIRLIGTVVDDDACSMRDAISTEQSNQRII